MAEGEACMILLWGCIGLFAYGVIGYNIGTTYTGEHDLTDEQVLGIMVFWLVIALRWMCTRGLFWFWGTLFRILRRGTV
jgi:hypothetical protein